MTAAAALPAVLAAGHGSIITPAHLISSYGTLGVIAIIFAETGLLIGFFLPGDSLLVVAGAYCATTKAGSPHLHLAALLPGVAVAAVVGGFVGYAIGWRAGEGLFTRDDSRLFKRRYVVRTREVMEEYGEVKAVLLARVIPVVRTFINPMMGAVQMSRRTFAIANIAGGLIWSLGVTLIGYALGRSVSIDKYVLPITFVVVVASVIPILLERRKQKARARG